ncbi:MAG: hypothetical protein AAB365_01090 [Patescibacteria group bacterium]
MTFYHNCGGTGGCLRVYAFILGAYSIVSVSPPDIRPPLWSHQPRLDRSKRSDQARTSSKGARRYHPLHSRRKN